MRIVNVFFDEICLNAFSNIKFCGVFLLALSTKRHCLEVRQRALHTIQVPYSTSELLEIERRRGDLELLLQMRISII